MLQSENWLRLKERLLRKNLQPYDVGGSGDCFFRSVSHQLFGTPDKHLQVRLSGVNNLRDYPHYYIEFNVDSSWLNYLNTMSTPGVWCDHIIIQAVANALLLIVLLTLLKLPLDLAKQHQLGQITSNNNLN
jgi:hypothetical protein